MKQKYVSNSVVILFPESMRPKFCICIPEWQAGQFKDMKVFEPLPEKKRVLRTLSVQKVRS
jgi:hypothetical protein